MHACVLAHMHAVLGTVLELSEYIVIATHSLHSSASICPQSSMASTIILQVCHMQDHQFLSGVCIYLQCLLQKFPVDCDIVYHQASLCFSNHFFTFSSLFCS